MLFSLMAFAPFRKFYTNILPHMQNKANINSSGDFITDVDYRVLLQLLYVFGSKLIYAEFGTFFDNHLIIEPNAEKLYLG